LRLHSNHGIVFHPDLKEALNSLLLVSEECIILLLPMETISQWSA